MRKVECYFSIGFYERKLGVALYTRGLLQLRGRYSSASTVLRLYSYITQLNAQSYITNLLLALQINFPFRISWQTSYSAAERWIMIALWEHELVLLYVMIAKFFNSTDLFIHCLEACF